LNLNGEPVTLGLVIVPGDKTMEDYEDEEEDEEDAESDSESDTESEEIRPFD
jgi:hypothetical protein